MKNLLIVFAKKERNEVFIATGIKITKDENNY
jgi:hypothetical protein